LEELRPMDQIQWGNPTSWDKIVEEGLGDRFERKVLVDLSTSQDLDQFDDDSIWIEMIHDAIEGTVEDTTRRIIEKIKQKEVISFHACRPLDIGEYTEHGIQPLNRERLMEQISSMAYSNHLVALKLQEIEKAVNEWEPGIDEGRVFTALDDRELLHNSGHYLVYGSETVNSILMKSGLKGVLKSTGIPTIFRICQKLSQFNMQQHHELASEMLLDWSRRKLTQSDRVTILNFTLFGECVIPPERILGHNHPPNIFDPIEWRDFVNDRVTCDLCRR
jgi:hypothetical protein